MDTKALKDKIIQLAIQGKLVAQDENDEPANILLEKIKDEKEQLIKERNLKKSKINRELYIEDKTLNLPKSWVNTRLGEICLIKTGRLNSSDSNENGEYPFFTCGAEVLKTTEYEFDCDAILLGGNNATGNFKLHQYNGKFNAYQRVYVIENIIAVKEYIYYCVRYNLQRLQQISIGTATKYLKLGQVESIFIPLPPLEEQKRIVAKIDSLFKLIDKLDSNKQDLLQYICDARSKVLQLAIQGKLLPQNENDEPASVLLERIKEEKEQLIKDKVIKKEKPLPEITEDEKLFEVPNGWEWCRLCDITHSNTLNDGDWILSSNMNERGTVKLIQLGSIGDGKYIDKGFKTITNETFDELKCREICEGDILINRLLGKKMLACILPKIEGKKITSVDTCFIKPNKNIYNSKFILYLVLSKYFQDEVYSKVAGTTRQRISKGNLVTIPFPLPPLEEQKRIVAKLDTIMNYLDILEKQIV